MITVESQPDDFIPAYSEQRWVVSSDNTSQPNFKFIADIYINGTYVTRLKRPSHPDFPSCVFDPHRIVESFVTHDIALSSGDGFYKNSNSYCRFELYFGEEYGLDSSGVTVYPDLDTSQITYGYCASPNSLDYVDWVGSNYLLKTIAKKFLHSFPVFYSAYRGCMLERNQNFFLSMATFTTNKIDKLVIITYDDTRTMIDEYQIDNPYVDITGDYDSRFLRCPIGYNANDIDSMHLTTGTQPIFTDSVKYFKVYTIDTSFARTSEYLYFELYDSCTVYDSFEIHWLDPLGGFNSFVFDHVHNENVKIERKQYKQQVGTQFNNIFSVAKSDRGYQNYFTSLNSEIKVRSGWITETQFSFLKTMKESPQVFFNDGGDLIAINIIDTDYEVKQVVNTNLINFEITFKYSVNNYRQRY